MMHTLVWWPSLFKYYVDEDLLETLYFEMAQFDLLTGQNNYRDVLNTYLSAATQDYENEDGPA